MAALLPFLEMALGLWEWSASWLSMFKSFLLGSQDLKVNLCGLQQDIHSDSVK